MVRSNQAPCINITDNCLPTLMNSCCCCTASWTMSGAWCVRETLLASRISRAESDGLGLPTLAAAVQNWLASPRLSSGRLTGTWLERLVWLAVSCLAPTQWASSSPFTPNIWSFFSLTFSCDLFLAANLKLVLLLKVGLEEMTMSGGEQGDRSLAECVGGPMLAHHVPPPARSEQDWECEGNTWTAVLSAQYRHWPTRRSHLSSLNIHLKVSGSNITKFWSDIQFLRQEPKRLHKT